MVARTSSKAATLVAAYSLCSSTMLVVNKVAVRELPIPALVSGTQLLFSSSCVLLFHLAGWVTLVRPRRRVLEPFTAYVAAFALGVYANIKALELTSVGAVIAARSCLPLLVALLEYWFMGRQFPSPKSCAALCCVLLFAGVYVTTDSSLSLDDTTGLAWLALWFCLLAFQMTYGKVLSDGAELSPHDRVFWTNALSLPFTLTVSLATGELGGGGFKRSGSLGGSSTVLFTPAASWWLFASCLVGLGISYSGWMLKAAVSATLFTLVGVVNKMATIALSAAAFPGTLSPTGGFALTACILAGCAFRDAPMRGSKEAGGGDKSGGDAAALSGFKKSRDSTLNMSPRDARLRGDDTEGANGDGGVLAPTGTVHLRGR